MHFAKNVVAISYAGIYLVVFYVFPSIGQQSGRERNGAREQHVIDHSHHLPSEVILTGRCAAGYSVFEARA